MTVNQKGGKGQSNFAVIMKNKDWPTVSSFLKNSCLSFSGKSGRDFDMYLDVVNQYHLVPTLTASENDNRGKGPSSVFAWIYHRSVLTTDLWKRSNKGTSEHERERDKPGHQQTFESTLTVVCRRRKRAHRPIRPRIFSWATKWEGHSSFEWPNHTMHFAFFLSIQYLECRINISDNFVDEKRVE